eukprot:scaffold88283_cov61-Phaeocystis_antarctica.AAC.1
MACACHVHYIHAYSYAHAVHMPCTCLQLGAHAVQRGVVARGQPPQRHRPRRRLLNRSRLFRFHRRLFRRRCAATARQMARPNVKGVAPARERAEQRRHAGGEGLGEGHEVAEARPA